MKLEILIDFMKFHMRVPFVICCGAILIKDSVLMLAHEEQAMLSDKYAFNNVGHFYEI
jgi:hypothetical protein